MKLHEAIEEVLEIAGKSMTTTEIADQINARGLYAKRDGSPVSALQIHGRTRNYPRLFSQAGSTISLAGWSASSRNGGGSGGNLAETPSLPTLQTSGSLAAASDVETALFAPSVFRPAGEVDPDVPNLPGLYAIRIRDRQALPEPFGSLCGQRGHDLLYVGIARTSLKRRFLEQELRARGHGTFFRSIGAVLGFRPPVGSLIDKKNKRNYSFAPSDERAIITWVNENLLVNWLTLSSDHEAIERELLRKTLPLLNLSGNPGALPELSALRAECVLVANAVS
ncbi:winged helix-turn-helix domain-containing protein [Humidisolicoccus flavus]|uniref:winged helix-turn-helix domain-containing protein n=1 Tax=Humidisolicoccus flavus TaxID=3111414 RepID=UPI00324FBEC3